MSSIPTPNKSVNTGLPFVARNYVLILVGVLLIGIGYWLMAGEKFIDSKQFSMALWVSPILILGGFAWIIYAILWHPKNG